MAFLTSALTRARTRDKDSPRDNEILQTTLVSRRLPEAPLPKKAIEKAVPQAWKEAPPDFAKPQICDSEATVFNVPSKGHHCRQFAPSMEIYLHCRKSNPLI